MYNPIKPSKTKVLTLIKKTWDSPYLSITSSTYAIFKRKFDFREVDHTDGIGTKGYYHWKKKTLKNAVIDALAMNLNDLAMVGAVPYKLQNHIVLPIDDTESILEIVRSLVKECLKRKIAITGGETSIQDTCDGIDISITVSGFIKKNKVNQFQIGDVLIGLPSSGIHSNGITRIRELFKNKIEDEFTTPTKIYSDILLPIFDKYDLHGRMHITGGAFTKLKDLLNGADAIITSTHKLVPQPVFYKIYKKGVTDKEMYKTFNCGVGFVLSVKSENVKAILKATKGEVIGKIRRGSGKVVINSMFSKKTVKL